MGRWHFHVLIWSGLLLWATGIAWLWLHFIERHPGDFGPVTHPLEPWMLRLHGFFLIPTLISLGPIIFGHIGYGWRWRVKRPSGLITLTALSVLIGTGYLLYYASDEVMRDIAKYAHWAVGAAAPGALIWHMLTRINRLSDKPPK